MFSLFVVTPISSVIGLFFKRWSIYHGRYKEFHIYIMLHLLVWPYFLFGSQILFLLFLNAVVISLLLIPLRYYSTVGFTFYWYNQLLVKYKLAQSIILKCIYLRTCLVRYVCNNFQPWIILIYLVFVWVILSGLFIISL